MLQWCVTLCSVTHLSRDALDISKGDALIIGADDELEEVVPQDLKHHAHVSPINTADLEVVQQLHCLVTLWIIFIRLSNLSDGSRRVRLTALWCHDKKVLLCQLALQNSISNNRFLRSTSNQSTAGNARLLYFLKFRSHKMYSLKMHCLL